ncbi:hypothetical protein PAHAL_2G265000 [Panicum hallii]|jgi:hypothetical protein|uniref:Uncharacterized protein n=1 Tax=Panicum hallii TaxID=206008 RepID=A0A2T8KQG2_9POAL|nr:hypothetical protein PAHAL_2G265000 [Panicum hallii]
MGGVELGGARARPEGERCRQCWGSGSAGRQGRERAGRARWHRERERRSSAAAGRVQRIPFQSLRFSLSGFAPGPRPTRPRRTTRWTLVRLEVRFRFQRTVPPSHRYIPPRRLHHDFVRLSSSAPVTHEAKPIVRPLVHRRQTSNPSESQLRTPGTPRVAMATLFARPADCFACSAFFKPPLRLMQQRKSQATASRPVPGQSQPARGRANNRRQRRRQSPPVAGAGSPPHERAMVNVVILKRGEQILPVPMEASTAATPA